MAVRSGSKFKLTYEDYAALPTDGRVHQIIDGEHVVNPAPTPYHQRVSSRILVQLIVQLQEPGLAEVLPAPIDVQLSETDIVQPDLVVLHRANLHIVTPTKIKGAPDLVVEVLSPSTARVDRVLKRELYRRAGVAEFWIVDPDEHMLEQLRLEDGDYRPLGRHAEEVVYAGLPQVRIDLRRVW